MIIRRWNYPASFSFLLHGFHLCLCPARWFLNQFLLNDDHYDENYGEERFPTLPFDLKEVGMIQRKSLDICPRLWDQPTQPHRIMKTIQEDDVELKWKLWLMKRDKGGWWSSPNREVKRTVTTCRWVSDHRPTGRVEETEVWKTRPSCHRHRHHHQYQKYGICIG